MHWKGRLAPWLIALASSCTLPQFSIVPSFDEGAGGSVAGTGASPMAVGGMGSTAQAGNGGTGPLQGDAGESHTSLPGAAGDGHASAGGAAASCTSPRTNCDGICEDTTNDPLNCGRCFVYCPTGLCRDSQCACPVGKILCGDVCLDLNDERSCGSCKECAGPASCVEQSCVDCPTGCAELSVPFTAEGQRVRYFISFDSTVNLAGAKITVRSFHSRTEALYVSVVNSIGQSFGAGANNLGPLEDFIFEVPTEGGFDKSARLQLEVSCCLGTPAHTAKVWVDRITIDSGVAGPWEFGDGTAPLEFFVDGSGVIGTLSHYKP